MSVASVHHVSYYSNLGMISEKACLRFDSDLIIHKMVLAMVVLLRAKKKSRVGPVVVEMMMYKSNRVSITIIALAKTQSVGRMYFECSSGGTTSSTTSSNSDKKFSNIKTV